MMGIPLGVPGRWTRHAVAGLAIVLSAACGGGDATPASAGGADSPASLGEGDGAGIVLVRERWVSARDTLSNVDTPALWVGDGDSRLLVTGKDSHDLRVYDGATGASLQPIGAPGEALGSFLRPNAVVVVEDLGFVVERDNARVQLIELPSGRPLGAFGQDVLEFPYGVVVEGTLPDLTLWVTDDYEVADSTAPDLTRRLHRFSVRVGGDGTPRVEAHQTFGAASGPGALAVVESIGLDPALERLFVADEARKAYAIYDPESGSFTGRFLAEGAIQGDPEGLALVTCPGGEGYWIVTDQRPDVSVFLVIDRISLETVGAFRGEVTANTDGVTFAHGPVPGFEGGVFYTVHDDQAVSSFAWSDIRAALDLREGCGVTQGER